MGKVKMIESHVGKVKMDLITGEFTVIIPLRNKVVRTRFNLNPEQEWIQAHVAQTINL